eukprot:TRINITY_DN2836_c0_g1_i1.p1 TRINITY_DN2836_c0_g1~~TRINITY_DN2836_c0_g1_i1.p1  ORF type:complete len:348 (-),score=164.58 TRINITY_DN2836_c0_g1_i1:45-1040(-)
MSTRKRTSAKLNKKKDEENNSNDKNDQNDDGNNDNDDNGQIQHEAKTARKNFGLDLSPLLTIQPQTSTVEEHELEFARIANSLLNECVLFVKRIPHRLIEIEFYFQNQEHPDPFVHCDPKQKQMRNWYFHKSANSYRGGTFKGLDIAFSQKNAFAGILIRAIKPLGEKIVEGPSKSVDHILKLTGKPSVAALADNFNLIVDDQDNPIYIRHCENAQENMFQKAQVYTSARVGLTLKNQSEKEKRIEYIGKNYRYFIEPESIKKGKHYIIAALHFAGKSASEIRTITKSTENSISQFIRACDSGLNEDPKNFIRKELSPEDVCCLLSSCKKQ